MTPPSGVVSGRPGAAVCHNGVPYTVGSDTRNALSITPNACLTAYSTREGILPCR